jgi:PadR family transcriptional regulator PadR
VRTLAWAAALLRERERDGFERERDDFELVGVCTDADGLVTSEGTLYRLLARLRQDGLVDKCLQESNQGPPRRDDRITRPGNKSLASFAEQWDRFRRAVDRVLERGGVT